MSLNGIIASSNVPYEKYKAREIHLWSENLKTMTQIHQDRLMRVINYNNL